MLDGLSNFQVFAVAAVFDVNDFNSWKTNQENTQKTQPQSADVTNYANSYANSYSNVPYSNTYTNTPAQNSYTNNPRQDSYANSARVDSYSNSPRVDSYSNSPAQNSYSNASYSNSYSNSPAQNSYSNSPAQNSYSNSPYSNSYSNTPYSNSYSNSPWQEYYDGGSPIWSEYYDRAYHDGNQWSNIPHRDSYSNSPGSNSYSNSPARNSYSNSPYSNSYSNSPAQNSYSNSPARNSYANTPYSNSYSNSPTQNSYSNTPAQNSYTNIPYANSYANSAKVDTYSNVPYANSYTNITTDTGFDHINYIPYRPSIYGLDTVTKYRGIITFGFYSHDHNNTDLTSTQTAQAKTVKYDIYIKPQGQPDTSYVLLSGDITANTYDFNTATKPDGNYTIKIVGKNDTISQKGVTKTYISQQATADIILKQNTEPVVSIQNGSEFINFTFSRYGAKTGGNNYKAYNQHLYASNYARNWGKEDGILVKVSMTDADVTNWQKGTLSLLRPDSSVITTVDIYWSDVDTNIGADKVSSANAAKTGYAYIPATSIPDLTDLSNCRLSVAITDYEDSNCTIPAGGYVAQTQVSATDTTSLVVNIDTNTPTVSANDVNYNWRGSNANVTLTFSDATSGMNIRQYQITTSTATPGSWNNYTGPVAINGDGQFYLHYNGVDYAGNTITGYFGPYKIDTTIPDITAVKSLVPNSDNIRIDVTATDTLSGIRRIRLPNLTWVNASTAQYIATTPGTYTFVAENNAGLTNTINVLVEDNPVVNGLTMTSIANAPLGTTAPVNYPVGTPTRIKAGYNMTFNIATADTDTIQVKLYANGSPLTVYVDGVATNTITVSTGTRAQTTTSVHFWFDKYLAKGTVIDMKIITTKTRQNGDVTSNVNTDLGTQFAKIVGSSLEDSDTNIKY